MSTCDILFILGYLFICFTAFAGHLVTLFVKIKNGDTWQEDSGFGFGGSRHPYEFSFYENIVGWGLVSLVPVVNIIMIIYDVVYLANPFIEKLDKTINSLLGAASND